MSDHLKVISVAGCIGSGKSSALNLLRRREGYFYGYNLIVELEPVESWQSGEWLSDFYKDRMGKGFIFQTKVLMDQLLQFERWVKWAKQNYDQFGTRTLVVCERCPVESREVFVKHLPISEREKALFVEMTEKCGIWKPDFRIGLTVDKDEMLRRILGRNRCEEVVDSSAYYEELLITYSDLYDAGFAVPVSSSGPSEDVEGRIFEEVMKFVKDQS